MHMHLRPILTIALFTLREAIQNRLISLVLAALISLFGLAEFIGEVAITESAETKLSILSSALRFFAVLVTSLFVTMSMLREQHEKSLDLVLSLPISRASYFFGRLLGFSGVTIVVAALIGLCLLLYSPSQRVGPWVLSLACELFIVANVSIVCLFTFRQATLALSSVFGFYVLARTIGSIQLIGHGPLADPSAPSQRLISGVIDTLALLLPDLDRYTSSQWLIYGAPQGSDLVSIIGQTTIYLTLLIGVGLFDLYRKNF